MSLNAARATLDADPAGFATPDCSGPAGPCFFPHVNGDSAWGYGAGVGIRYKLTPAFALGASYNTEDQLPGLRVELRGAPTPACPPTGRTARSSSSSTCPPGRGRPRLDPQRPAGAVALDGKWINYENAAGFKDILGFKDIKVYEIGVQYKATDKLALRAGYNHAENADPGRADLHHGRGARRSSRTTTASASASRPPTS